MDKNLVKFRMIRLSTWTAIGLALLAISLMVIGVNSKGDISLHLKVWGIQLTLVAFVIAIIAALLRTGLRCVRQRIIQHTRKRWCWILRREKSTVSGTTPYALANKDDEEQKPNAPWNREPWNHTRWDWPSHGYLPWTYSPYVDLGSLEDKDNKH